MNIFRLISSAYQKRMPFLHSKGQIIPPFVILLVLIAVMGIIAASIFYSASRKEAVTRLSEDLTSRLMVFSGLVASATEKYEYLPRLVSEYLVISDALSHPGDRKKILQTNRLLERLKQKAGVSDIYVMDARGNTIASSNWNMKHSFVGNNYAFRPYFFDAMNKGTGRFYAIGITSHVPGYYLSYRIEKDNIFLGVVAVKVNISGLPVSWSSRKVDILVADERSVIFLSSRADWQYRSIWELTELEQSHIESMRQYQGMLKKGALFEIEEILGSDERIVKDRSERSWYGLLNQSYFIKDYILPGSDWTIYAVAPMDDINGHARMVSYTAFGSVFILVFMLMGIHQFYLHGRERKKYLHGLEEAHQELEKKNGELRALNEELHFHSITDPLTGVFNRRHFIEMAEQSLRLSNRHGFPLSVFMIDVDHFKRINDTYGHPAGDAVLQTLVTLFKVELRESDILARWGGEEFVIALPHTDEREASLVAERIRSRVMAHPIDVGSESITATVSSGVAQFRFGESDIDDVIRRADQALYQAKGTGRNMVCSSSSLVF